MIVINKFLSTQTQNPNQPPGYREIKGGILILPIFDTPPAYFGANAVVALITVSPWRPQVVLPERLIN